MYWSANTKVQTRTNLLRRALKSCIQGIWVNFPLEETRARSSDFAVAEMCSFPIVSARAYQSDRLAKIKNLNQLRPNREITKIPHDVWFPPKHKIISSRGRWNELLVSYLRSLSLRVDNRALDCSLFHLFRQFRCLTLITEITRAFTKPSSAISTQIWVHETGSCLKRSRKQLFWWRVGVGKQAIHNAAFNPQTVYDKGDIFLVTSEMHLSNPFTHVYFHFRHQPNK